MGADLGVPLSDLRPLCVLVAGGESRKTFTQFSKREKREVRERRERANMQMMEEDEPLSSLEAPRAPALDTEEGR